MTTSSCTRKTISGVTTTRYYAQNHEVVINSLGEETYIIYLCNGSIAIHDDATDTRTLYHGYYDAQGSLIALTDNSGNVIARYAYDPWGKRVAAGNWGYSPTYTPTLNIDRGYTMHEHLDEFGLINMNGRVYDPSVAQFLSPAPYIQDGGNWLNYNRYAYCYNNPTRYTDPDGEYVHIIIGAVIGGIVNVWTNQDSCEGVGEVMAAFGAGALAGGLGAVTGGAAWVSIASATIGGATLSGVNSLIEQTGKGFSGQVNWKDVGKEALGGAISSGVSAGLSSALSGFISNGVSNAMSTRYPNVNMPIIESGIANLVGTAVGDGFGTFAGEWLISGSYQQARSEALNAAAWGGASGFLNATIGGFIENYNTGMKNKNTDYAKTNVENELNSERSIYESKRKTRYRNEPVPIQPPVATETLDIHVVPTVIPDNNMYIEPKVIIRMSGGDNRNEMKIIHQK